jgi:1,4-alpha-glucan branching enzyme
VAAGSFLLALHGHMPWVLGHGRWPHGEAWLYEAAAGVYLPLLGVVDEVHAAGARAPITLGLTPVLLEQLRAPGFGPGFRAWLEARIVRAKADQGDPGVAPLARWWREHHERLLAGFDALGGDIVGAFAEHAREGRIELLSSFATHGFAPLLKHDRAVRAQLRVGLATSERHLGFRPSGIWLPECAFRPEGPWTGPVLGVQRERRGVDRILDDEGVTHFFVDAHLVAGARAEGVVNGGVFEKVGWERAEQHPEQGWRSVLEPHRVGTHGGMSRVTAFARHPDVSEQVWSADAGYPGDGRYLEFHKRRGDAGHRYWRVTARDTDLGGKAPYDPAAVPAAVHAHAAHFSETVGERISAWRNHTGRDGCLTAAFDAELFGHWWFEGPGFLRDVLLTLHHDPRVRVETAAARLARVPPDKVAWLPAGTWGHGGDDRVWINDRTRWTWEVLYRAEDRFLGLLWQGRQPGSPAAVVPLLRDAARELLLMQASDWQFVIETGGAVDYGFRRFAVHLDRFEAMCALAGDALAGRPAAPVDRATRAAALTASGDAFADLDLDAWLTPG